MSKQQANRRLAILILILSTIVAACSGQTSRSSTPGTPIITGTVTPAETDQVIVSVLQNIAQNGFDGSPAVNNGLGGLWINWSYGTSPLVVNGGKNTNPPGHDRLTDLRYLHVLWSYQSLHPTDKQFAGQIQKYTPIVQAEFANGTDIRGWIYDEWADLYRLSNDQWYQRAAYNIANYYYTQWYHPSIGALYETSTSATGEYRTEDAVGMASALIQAGSTFNQPQWTQAGITALSFLNAHAYLPQYHVYLHLLTNIVSPDGTANPDEAVAQNEYQQTDGATVAHDGGVVHPGGTGAIAIALMRAYTVTHNQAYLQQAVDMLTALSAQTNPLGLWDSTNLGYFYGERFSGPTAHNAGAPTLVTKFKESGRQLQMLTAYHLADLLTNGQFQSMENLMLQVAVGKAYYAPGHGYMYQMTNDWQPTAKKNGKPVVVTTEAMGIALQALFSLSSNNPSDI